MNKNLTQGRSGRRLLLACVCALASSGVAHADLSAAFSTSIGRSDNILRTDDNQIEENIASVGVELDYVHTGPRLSADLFVNADYIDYIDGAFDNEVLGGATLVSDYWFSPDRFGWNLQYNYGQQVFDPLRPITPDNRENVSYLTTGPQITLPLGSRFEISANADYSNTTYEVNPNDQERFGGRLSLVRLLNAGRSIAIVGTQERVQYDENVVAPDFDRTGVFLRFESINTRGTFTFDIGANQLELDGVDEKSDGILVRLDWTRIISDGIELTVSGGSRYSDQGDIFRFFQNAAFDLRETEDVAGLATPFRNNFGSLIFDLDRGRTRIDLVVIHSDEDYEFESTFDRRVTQLNFLVGRDITRKVFGEFGINASSRQFEFNDRDDRDVLYSLSLGYRFNEAVSTTLSYQNFNRDSNQGVTEFDENRIFLRLSYVPRWSR